MGCDIHVSIETKGSPEEWDCWGTDITLWRNYDLFAVLAGVRNYRAIIPHVNQRGLPNNLSWRVDEALERGNDHSHSWLWLAELESAYAQYRTIYEPYRTIEFPPIKELEAIIAAMRVLNGDDPDGSRLVFWFDN